MSRLSVLALVLAGVVLAGCGSSAPRARTSISVYRSLEWTRGQQVRVRYCQRPGGPGNFLAASEGVTCGTAAAVARAITSRCYPHSSCVVASFHCRSYWNGQFGASFENVHHALCTDGARRVLWDGG